MAAIPLFCGGASPVDRVTPLTFGKITGESRLASFFQSKNDPEVGAGGLGERAIVGGAFVGCGSPLLLNQADSVQNCGGKGDSILVSRSSACLARPIRRAHSVSLNVPAKRSNCWKLRPGFKY